jgi:hypothetical protein
MSQLKRTYEQMENDIFLLSDEALNKLIHIYGVKLFEHGQRIKKRELPENGSTTFIVDNIADVIRIQRFVHDFSSRKIKDIKQNISNPTLTPVNNDPSILSIINETLNFNFIFNTCYEFKDFKTHYEETTLNENSRRSYISTIGKYTQFFQDEEWKEISVFIPQLKNALKQGKCKKESIEFIKKVISLMFICETSRNAATYLILPMYFELLENKKVELECFPTALEGSLARSRYLNNELYSELEFKYEGSQNSNDYNILIERENIIVRDWFKLKGLKEQSQVSIRKLIQHLIEEWYGIDIGFSNKQSDWI